MIPMKCVPNFKRSKLIRLFFVLIFASALDVLAEDKAAPSQVESTLRVELDGERLMIVFEASSEGILGYAGSAITPKQKQEVLNAKATLGSPSLIFSMSPKNCRSTNRSIDTSAILDEGSSQSGQAAETKKTASNANDLIRSSYFFECDPNEAVETISVVAFRQFPGIKTINTSWVKGEKKGQLSLNAKANVISFK